MAIHTRYRPHYMRRKTATFCDREIKMLPFNQNISINLTNENIFSQDQIILIKFIELNIKHVFI